MRILRVHNHYQQAGGEDVSFASEVALLRERGHEVETLVVSNDAISADRSPTASARLAASTVWSRSGRALVAEAVSCHHPDIVHFDNTFPLICPAAYSAARTGTTAIVQTLHNYRLLCLSATLFRDGHPCEDCVRRVAPTPGIVHACYRGSTGQSAAVAAMLTAHRLRRTWTRDVDRYIALTDFARDLFVEGGLPADRIAIKPNFVQDPARSSCSPRRNVFLFVGRLSPEKGVGTMLAAARRLPAGYELHVAGAGALASQVAAAHARSPAVVPLGRLAHDAVLTGMAGARALVFPSSWYEGCPMTIIEAFACGLPVIAARIGAMSEMIRHRHDGLLFEPGSTADLADKLHWLAAHPAEAAQMGHNARTTYESAYTPNRNYDMLMRVYKDAVITAARS